MPAFALNALSAVAAQFRHWASVNHFYTCYVSVEGGMDIFTLKWVAKRIGGALVVTLLLASSLLGAVRTFREEQILREYNPTDQEYKDYPKWAEQGWSFLTFVRFNRCYIALNKAHEKDFAKDAAFSLKVIGNTCAKLVSEVEAYEEKQGLK